MFTVERGSVLFRLRVAPEFLADHTPEEIIALIRSTPETPRSTEMAQKDLSEIRKKIEKHITNTYFKSVQAPVGVKPALKCWMELN